MYYIDLGVLIATFVAEFFDFELLKKPARIGLASLVYRALVVGILTIFTLSADTHLVPAIGGSGFTLTNPALVNPITLPL